MPIYQLTLIDRKIIAHETIECHFEKPAELTFTPGQYGGFSLPQLQAIDIKQATRLFSLLSTPHDSYLAIATRIKNSLYKPPPANLPIGGKIKFAGPSGNFILHEDMTKPVILIAGGIGIVPFYSMIRETLHQPSERSLTLFYGNESIETTAFYTELETLSKTQSTFKFIPTFSTYPSEWLGEKGWITDQMIKKYVSDLYAPIYYVCGAGGMVSAIHNLLHELDIPEDQIRCEDFPGY